MVVVKYFDMRFDFYLILFLCVFVKTYLFKNATNLYKVHKQKCMTHEIAT